MSKPTIDEILLANKKRFVASRSPEKAVDKETDKTDTQVPVTEKVEQKTSQEPSDTTEQKQTKAVNTKKTTAKRTRKPVAKKQD